jgi:protein SCO1
LRGAPYQSKAGSAMNKLLAALALTLLAACQASTPQPAPLEGARMGGPFTLTDQDGKTVSDTQFTGQYRLIYFGYTFCPDVCPVDVQKLMAGFRQSSSRSIRNAIRPPRSNSSSPPFTPA